MPVDLKEAPAQHHTARQSPESMGFVRRYTALIASVLFGAATTGYFLGLTSPMTANKERVAPVSSATRTEVEVYADRKVIPATAYADMAKYVRGSTQRESMQLANLRQEPYDLFANRTIDEAEKSKSLAQRETRRAYDGAPPTVPHPADQLSSAACMACHGEGLKSKSLRAGKMPHPYYANCMQCHVEQDGDFTIASADFENTFVGVTAPTSGSRAYPGAPPVIPHSTWMRSDCLSCHGRTSAPGMESTHPWRTNCLQCHVESSMLNQNPQTNPPLFLPAPEIVR